VERDTRAARILQEFAVGIPDIEINVLNNSFVDAIPEILEFVKSEPDTFAFYFIDPKGWTGFDMSSIRQLLEGRRSEVLINFMSYHINRFIRVPEYAGQFADLYGRPDFLEAIEYSFSECDFEEAMVRVYCEELKKSGFFEYVGLAYVIHRDMDCKHFHLVYGTRNIRGLEEFRKAEKVAMGVMEEARITAQQKGPLHSGQGELFCFEEIQGRWEYYEHLREQQLKNSRLDLLRRLKEKERSPFDEFWAYSLQYPLVWRSDIFGWIEEWRKAGNLRIDGLNPNERVPKYGKNHMLVWLEPTKA
jgi:hypothetical protein